MLSQWMVFRLCKIVFKLFFRHFLWKEICCAGQPVWIQYWNKSGRMKYISRLFFFFLIIPHKSLDSSLDVIKVFALTPPMLVVVSFVNGQLARIPNAMLFIRRGYGIVTVYRLKNKISQEKNENVLHKITWIRQTWMR